MTFVAASNSGNSVGSIYVYEWNGSSWDETKLTASDGAVGDGLGYCIAVSGNGNTVAAGSPNNTSDISGAVYLHE